MSGILKDLKPDLVLLLGDIVDGEIGPVLRGIFFSISPVRDALMDLYAITGNHEFIGGASQYNPLY